MRIFYILVLVALLTTTGFSQTCTVTGTSPLNWVNAGPSCVEGGTAGTAGITTLIIPANFTVIFNSNGDTWGTAGQARNIEVYGTLRISHDVTINSSITVHANGKLELQAKLFLGDGTGCGYSLGIEDDGVVDVGGTGSDRLSICGKQMMQGGGGPCNSCGGTNSGACPHNGNPYCEPSGGFPGPLGYDETGYNDGVLPITLLSFEGHPCKNAVCLEWSTATEENFDKFIIEHSIDGQNFDSIGYVAGSNNSKTRLDYKFTDDFPILGKNYYRLKSVDLDRTFEYSSVILIESSGEKNIVVYPNPVKGPSIQLRTNFNPAEGDLVQIFDNLGLKIFEYKITGIESTLAFDRSLKPGSYLLRYNSNNYSQVIRFTSN